MKNNVLKFYITALFLCSAFVMVAQPGDGNGGTGDAALEGQDVAAPIDGYVWFLGAIGLVYVFLRLRAFKLEGNSSEE